MIWFIIAALIAVVVGYRTYHERYLGGWGEAFFMGFVALFLASMGAMVLNLAFIKGPNANCDKEWRLTSLQDGTSTSGRFFLGSGVIDEHPSFMYYRQDADGYRLESIKAAKVRIVYNEGAPRLTKKHKCYDPDKGHYFWSFIHYEDSPSYVFYVPAGSIKQDIVLDAK